ncbi:hypothetical protein KAW18_07170 [candidate division WOR-3 bacterium]|nr:hypothetical protein [candidate division WOR-3 bacterium]
MKVRIKKIDWLAKEIREAVVTFSVRDENFTAFSYPADFEVGDEVDIEVSIGIEGGPSEWEEMFSGNPDKKKCLIKKKPGNWEYSAYGRVVKIQPLIVDVGPFKLEYGYITHDPRVVGEYVYFEILRLDIFLKDRDVA